MAERRRSSLGFVLAVGLGIVALFAVGAAVSFYRSPLRSFERLGRVGLRAAGLERAEAKGPRGRLVYFRGGRGPAVVLLHGANDQAGAWVRVARPLARGHRLLVLDLPGHGESEPGTGPLSVADLLGGVEALLLAEAGGGKATLVGNSLGGVLALFEAHRHPERVAQVVLVNGAAIRGDGPAIAISLLPKTRGEARTAMEALTGPGAPRVPDFVLDDLVRRAPGSPLERLLRSPDAAHTLDGKLGEVRAPVTLLWGDADRLMPPSYAERVQRELPAARLRLIPGCGHAPQRECPEKLLPLLEEALERPPQAEG